MSGGYWNYNNDQLCSEMFNLYPDYGAKGFEQSKDARERNPLEDPEISELVYDVFCLLHSADWYYECDTGRDCYMADVAYFKRKWLNATQDERVEREIEAAISKARKDLYHVLKQDAPNQRDVKDVHIKYFESDIEKIAWINVGDWIDLRAAERVEMKKGDYRLIRLGVGMLLPDGFEAHVLPRSSTANKFGIIQANSMGVIDHSYSGDEDEWKFPALAIRDTVIEKGDRIAQFRIMKNQPTIHFKTVSHLNEKSRGGFGSTGTR